MRYRIVQHCTDDFLHGSDYFTQIIADADYGLFQRLPIKDELTTIKELHMERSIPGMQDSLYVGVARFDGSEKFQSCVSFDLPSKDIVRATNDKFQGSKALCTGIGRIVFCSVLPCYPNRQEGGTIIGKDTIADVKYILNKLQYTKCIIAGDFHHELGQYKKLDDLIKDYGFTSYLDDHDTFVHPDGSKFNLDRMISNIRGLTVDHVVVHQPKHPKNHLAISYEVQYS